jgi:threonine aldolase
MESKQLSKDQGELEMDFIDLRSDTVTWPTREMREAFVTAPVGDDVFVEDPTVLQLEADAARMLGKEAGLFLSSGTQGNLLAFLVHCRRGDEAIMGDLSHTFYYEAAGCSAVAGVMPHTVPVQPDGTLRLEDIEAAIRGVDVHYPTTRLICLENTQNKTGAKALTAEYTNSVAELAHRHGLQLHIDGARIFNAAAALNVPVSELVAGADSVTFCLSKGLCAPVGSVLVGTKEFIEQARRNRKMIGGGMRQAGVLAAAGLIALNKMSKRLHEDHEHAAQLAKAFAALAPAVEVVSCDTNFVLIHLHSPKFATPAEFIKAMWEQHKVRLGSPYPSGHLRLVTHYYINDAAVARIISAFQQLLA